MPAGFSFNLTGLGSRPADYVLLNYDWATDTLWGRNFFLVGGSLKCWVPAGKLTSSTYEVRDYYGDVLASGACAPLLSTEGGQDYFTLPSSLADEPKWMIVHFSRGTPIANWGSYQGGGMLSVWRDSSSLHDPPGPSDPLANNYSDSWLTLRSSALAGPPRLAIANAADPDDAGQLKRLSTAQADVALLDDWYTPFDTDRPKPLFLHFPNYNNAAGENAGVTSAVAALHPDVKYFEGRNEPEGTPVATWLPKAQAFYNAVKAGNPAAKVLGPCPVSITRGGAYQWLDDYLSAGGGAYIDALSVHDYNGTNGDLTLGRKVWDDLRALLERHGLGDIEIWMTEWGGFAATYGLTQPRLQGRWAMTAFILWEQYGLPKERACWFYDTSHGFWDFPSFWAMHPAAAFPSLSLMRVYSEELAGKTHTRRLRFGTSEDRHTLGSEFTAEDGSSVLAMMSCGRTDQTVELTVSGAASLDVVSPFGVVEPTAVSNGFASVSIDNGVPTYVRVPTGAIVNVRAGQYGPDLLRGATVTASGSGDRAQQVTDGAWETWYYRGVGSFLTDATAPFLDDTPSFPAWVECTTPSPVTLDRIVISCPPPWQGQGTLLDFDVQRHNGSTWVTLGSVTEPTKTLPWLADSLLGAGQVESYFSDRCVFVVDFAPATGTRWRIFVRDATLGGCPDQVSKDAGGQGGQHNICLRAVEGYNRSGLPAPKYGAKVA